MSKSFKVKFYTLFIILITTILFAISLFLYKQGVFNVYMKLNGKDYLTIEINEPYYELGVEVKHKFIDKKDQVQIDNRL